MKQRCFAVPMEAMLPPRAAHNRRTESSRVERRGEELQRTACVSIRDVSTWYRVVNFHRRLISRRKPVFFFFAEAAVFSREIQIQIEGQSW